MRFIKMQGAGNDFVLLEADNGQQNWPQLAIAICDRHYGIGADGLLLLLPSDKADFGMRIFNADGSESNTCGNGLRCIVKHYLDRMPDDTAVEEIMVETRAGIRRARIHHTNGKIAQIQTSMGQPGIGRDTILITPETKAGDIFDIKSTISYSLNISGTKLDLFLVSMGNPHAVCFLREPVEDFPLPKLGPQVERHKAFPEGVNFEIANVRDRRLIEARVWERGVGETLACGSGACAIGAAAQLMGYVDSQVDVMLPGGILNIEWDGTGEMFLSGRAETVFIGDWP
ncbi:MAG: diaminopimelate epimerase [Dehalococcoidales bacterium]|nr:MAG: diaminopimelate epimerase [Dehalococcoidales bacterium]